MPVVIDSDALGSTRSLASRFTCSIADGSPLSLPPRASRRHGAGSEVTFSDLALGMMCGAGAAGREHSLQHNLLQHARASWMPRMPGLGMLVLADCPEQATIAPAWLHTPEVSLAWRCYSSEAKPGKNLWMKTRECRKPDFQPWLCVASPLLLYASITFCLLSLSDALLSALYRIHPSRSFYMKMDVDALLLPSALLQYLNYLHDATAGKQVPLYFGSSAEVNNGLFCAQPYCFFRSAAWRHLRGNLYSNGTRPDVASLIRVSRGYHSQAHRAGKYSEARHRRAATVSYAAGGVYGFSKVALAMIVASDPPRLSCLHDAFAAVSAFRDSGHRVAHTAEDELIGLCMQLFRVPLLQCDCFYQVRGRATESVKLVIPSGACAFAQLPPTDVSVVHSTGLATSTTSLRVKTVSHRAVCAVSLYRSTSSSAQLGTSRGLKA